MMLLHMNDTSVLNNRRDGVKGYFKNKPTPPKHHPNTCLHLYTSTGMQLAVCAGWLGQFGIIVRTNVSDAMNVR